MEYKTVITVVNEKDTVIRVLEFPHSKYGIIGIQTKVVEVKE